MYTSLCLCIFLFIFVCLCYGYDGDDHQSPFVVLKNDTISASIALNATLATVTIDGVIADVKIVQIYENNGSENISVDYIFPVSTHACVYAMQFVYNDKIIVGELMSMSDAYAYYNEAELQGYTAALVELVKGNTNLVKLSISNIEPGEFLRAELFYTEILIPTNAQYEFNFPSVALPRYLTPDGDYEQPSDPSLFTNTFEIIITINPGIALQNVFSPTHPSMIIKLSANNFLAIAEYSCIGATVDILLNYVLSQDQIVSGVLVYESQLDNGTGMPLVWNASMAAYSPLTFTDNFFLAIIQTPTPTYITPFILPREYIFILDTSASMSGIPAQIMVELMSNLTSRLIENKDIFNIISFAGECIIFSNYSVPVTNSTIESALEWLHNLNFGGITLIVPALRKALEIPKMDGYSRNLAILTDGLVIVENEIFTFIRDNSGDANFFTFSLGFLPNRMLTQGIAVVGKGKEFWVQNISDATTMSEQFINYINTPILTSINITFSSDFGVVTDSIWPFQLSDVMVDRPLLICGKFTGKLPEGPLFNITAINATGSLWTMSMNAPNMQEVQLARALPFLWAQFSINEYQYTGPDPNDKEKYILDLSLQYHLLSEYTAFIGVDTAMNTLPTTYSYLDQPILPIISNDTISDLVEPANDPTFLYGLLPPAPRIVIPFTRNDPRPIECKTMKCGLYPFNQSINCGNCATTDLCLFTSENVSSCVFSIYTLPLNTSGQIDCYGSVSGANPSYLCDNQNFIYLTSINMSNPFVALEGNLCVEGDLDMSVQNLTMSDSSLIVTSGTLKIANALTINLSEASQKEQSVQIATAPKVQGTFKSVVVNLKSTECQPSNVAVKYVDQKLFITFDVACNQIDSHLVLILGTTLASVVVVVGVFFLIALYIKPKILFPFRDRIRLGISKLNNVPSKQTTYKDSSVN